MSETTFICALCGEEHPLENSNWVGDVQLCDHCIQDSTCECSRCGERIYLEDDAGAGSFHLCRSCYDRYYTRCERCDCILSVDDAYYQDDDEDMPYCYDCNERYGRTKVIHDYYYKPIPQFRGNGNRYFGVELEVDGAGEYEDEAGKVMEEANPDVENAYCKHDGSLDDGFEIVTHPMTLDYHLHTMPWGNIVDKAKELGYTSHQARTCGLHVHVNRNCFGDTVKEQEECIARVLYFFEKHWEELLKFSRRTQRQLDRWAARYGYKEQPKEILDHAKKGYHAGRYTSVNLQNTDTIEFRIFRGTLKMNTIFATLQLLDKICDVALYLTDEELKNLSWTSFVSGIQEDKYPNLIQYLKERRLYVNDTVNSEEEV